MSTASNRGTEFLADPDVTIWNGDAFETLRGMHGESVDCCVTSPPYWGLRDYGHADQLGLEESPAAYTDRLVLILREVRRVLKPAGTLWLNLGDSYAGSGKGPSNAISKQASNVGSLISPGRNVGQFAAGQAPTGWLPVPTGLKQKDLVGIPWRVAFALQTDGWWLRSDVIWSKPNPMPESISDRPTKAHEYVFLLSKSERYYFGQDDLREPALWERWGDQTVGPGSNPSGWIKPKTKNELAAEFDHRRPVGQTWKERKDNGAPPRHGLDGAAAHGESDFAVPALGRNVRSVWEIPTQPYPDAHFAVFPQELARRCILGGCPPGGTVLDPFGGSGTTALVARGLQRKAVLIELSEDYCALAAKRLQQLSLFAETA